MRECRCTSAIIQRCLPKSSGPLLDRIDLHIEVPAAPYKELRGPETGASTSADIRVHDRILKVARTIADLDASASVSAKHLAEAIQYRSLDRSFWS